MCILKRRDPTLPAVKRLFGADKELQELVSDRLLRHHYRTLIRGEGEVAVVGTVSSCFPKASSISATPLCSRPVELRGSQDRLLDGLLAFQGVENKWCPGTESNRRHCDFQSHALPTELPGHGRRGGPPAALRGVPIGINPGGCPPHHRRFFSSHRRRAFRGPDSLRPAIAKGRGRGMAFRRKAACLDVKLGRRSGRRMI